MKTIKVKLKLKNPSEEYKELDLKDKEEDILEAAFWFNEKFGDWFKRIIVIEVSKKIIHLLLVYERVTFQKFTARELRYFSSYLMKEKEWHNYIKNKNKLFESIEIKDLSYDEVHEYINLVEDESFIYKNQQIKDIDFLSCSYTSNAKLSEYTNIKYELSHEEMIATLNYLIHTKDKGNRHFEKTVDLKQIENILAKWV